MAEPLRVDEGSISTVRKAMSDVQYQTASCGRRASDLQVLERLYEVGNQCALLDSEFTKNLKHILDAAMFITTADKGALQLCDGRTGKLINAAQRGFEGPLLELVYRAGEE